MSTALRRARVRCPASGTSGSVVWYPGTPDAAIYSSLCSAVRLDPEETVEFSEDKETSRLSLNMFASSDSNQGGAVASLAVNECMPDGIALVARVAAGDDPSALLGSPLDTFDDGDGSYTLGAQEEAAPLLASSLSKPAATAVGAAQSTAGGSGVDDFQGQLLKFNRINAHLANERTYLAWARTVMSVLAVAFTLKTEASDAFSKNWRITWFVISCLFVAAANLVGFQGWSRYVKVKEVCTTESVREAELKMMRDNLGFSRLRSMTLALGVILGTTSVLYSWYGAADETWLSE